MDGRRLLLTHFRKYGWIYGGAFLLLASANVIFAFFPSVLQRFADAYEAKVLTQQAIVDYSLMLLAIGIAYGVLFGLGQYLNHRMGRIFEYNTRQRLFRHFTRLSEQYYSRTGRASC